MLLTNTKILVLSFFLMLSSAVSSSHSKNKEDNLDKEGCIGSTSYITQLNIDRAKAIKKAWKETDKDTNKTTNGYTSRSNFKNKRKSTFTDLFLSYLPRDILLSGIFSVPIAASLSHMKSSYLSACSFIQKQKNYLYTQGDLIEQMESDRKGCRNDLIEELLQYLDGNIASYDDFKVRSRYYDENLSDYNNLERYEYIQNLTLQTKDFVNHSAFAIGHTIIAVALYKILNKFYKNPLRSISDTVLNTSYLALGDNSIYDPYIETENLFAYCMPRLKRYHPKLYQKTLSKVIQMRQDNIRFLPQYIDYIETACSIPLGFDTSIEAVNSTDITNTFKYFDNDINDFFTPFINHFIDENLVDINKPYTCFLEGESGVGKTHFTKSLAKSLNIPLISLELDSCSLEELTGSTWKKEQYTYKGNLLNALIEPHFYNKNIPYTLNSIIHINKITGSYNHIGDKNGNNISFLLEPLINGSMKFYSEYLGVTIDLPIYTFIEGSDHTQFTSLLDQTPYIHFKGFNRKIKKNILKEEILPIALKKMNVDMDALSDKGIDNIVDLDSENRGLNYIFEELEKNIGLFINN